MMNKKGESKLLSLWWLFVLTVVAGVIVISTFIYYNSEIDINSVHSDLLAERIVDCISRDVYLRQEVMNDFDIIENCNLNSKIIEESGNFYFKLIIRGDDFNKDIIAGNRIFEKDCEIKEKVAGEHFPGCSRKSEKLLYNGKFVDIEILTGVNQREK
ncbi:hypothetical protein GF386_03060 [Candidatus Pacearchaeota archaeon]|nr:hypothetical protein [Candidatus Pacearchaeota archaeon]MBD3283119.1 hypothetical protein [Candidatus Pacearchaeota archaeon]